MPAASILIVEDVVQLAHIVKELLEAEDYFAHCAHTYEAGLAALQERRFDLLITDVNLGAISGVELIRKSQDITPGIKSLLMSGYPIAAELKKDSALRCTGFLDKPFTPSKLYDSVKHILDSDCV
jgi:DNA-binding NtrC family response regulator